MLTPALVESLRRLDACKVANAIETFDRRLRNEGFADSTIRPVTGGRPVVGHAVTLRIRGSSPPAVGHTYRDRTDWWSDILKVPAPRIVVAEDIDGRRGLAAFVGHVHARILRALGCVAYVTNGSVRDLPAVCASGFEVFAPSVAVSHGFVHIVDCGEPVTVGGLTVATGDILYGDIHGILSIPPEIVGDIPSAAEQMAAHEARVLAVCDAPGFSLEQLRIAVGEL